MRPGKVVVAIAAFAAFALASGCVQAQSKRPADADIRRYAALLAMADSRTLDRPLVDTALASAWSPLRAAAVLAIGQLGADHGMPAVATVRTLLNDADLTVASNAAYALGLLRDSSGVSALATALTGPPRVAREAAWSLGEIGAPARSIIVAALASPGADEARMIQLLFAAAKLRPVPVEDLRPYLRMTTKPAVVWAATYAIARTRAAAGARDLIALASSLPVAPTTASNPDDAPTRSGRSGPTADVYVANATAAQRTRSEIARGLAKPAAGDSLGDAAFEILSRLSRDTHPHVRINAIRSLATYGPRARASLIAVASDSDANVRIAMAQSAGTVLDSSEGDWNALWQRDTSLAFRASLLAAAASKGALRQSLVAWQGNSDWRYRAAAAGAAGSSNDRAYSASVATTLLRDRDARVRAAAYGILTGADTAAPSPAVHATLLAGLKDADFMVRATVIGTLDSHARAADVPAVLASYQLAARDSSNDARIAAVRYVASAWRRDSAAFAPALRTTLQQLPTPKDGLVRAEGARTSLFASWPSTSGTPRLFPYYYDIARTIVVPSLNGRNQMATVQTRRGNLVVELFGADAPLTVKNFVSLAKRGYYRGTRFHRVVPNFVAQDGDPRGDGNGGPGYAIRDEINPRRYDRGALGMALSGPDTGGSQYFIAHSPQPHLDGHYTVFGRVVSGYRVLDAIVQGDDIVGVVIQ